MSLYSRGKSERARWGGNTYKLKKSHSEDFCYEPHNFVGRVVEGHFALLMPHWIIKHRICPGHYLLQAFFLHIFPGKVKFCREQNRCLWIPSENQAFACPKPPKSTSCRPTTESCKSGQGLPLSFLGFLVKCKRKIKFGVASRWLPRGLVQSFKTSKNLSFRKIKKSQPESPAFIWSFKGGVRVTALFTVGFFLRNPVELLSFPGTQEGARALACISSICGGDEWICDPKFPKGGLFPLS